MARIEEGHGKIIGMSAAPSSQSIYGFILMLLMRDSIKAGTLAPMSGVGIGLAVGLAIMVSSIFQGKVCASGIQASAKQPGVYGKCFAAVGIIESFSLFSFVFALLLI
jgi:V/A-type H+-transporting ATPase subunit K